MFPIVSLQLPVFFSTKKEPSNCPSPFIIISIHHPVTKLETRSENNPNTHTHIHFIQSRRVQKRHTVRFVFIFQ